MKKGKMNINTLKDMLSNDPKALELLEFLGEVDGVIGSDLEDKKGYRLPYSSDPGPIGERWKTA